MFDMQSSQASCPVYSPFLERARTTAHVCDRTLNLAVSNDMDLLTYDK